jgi:4,5:9,10-diseco-3-hydroxy-5,9,17-trioxoandrosta-1(10),2-diene-4-oate hydrolase
MEPIAPTPGGDTAETASRNGHRGRNGYGPSGRSPWLDIDWRAHQRWVNVEGQLVNTIDMGAGRPILFVHGLSGSWPNWLEQLPVFAADHRVIAMDLPGFGHSPMPRERITISGYARLLDRLLAQLGIDKTAVVGNSMGGFISAEMAIAFPERVERLTLVSPAGLSTYRHRGTELAKPYLRRAAPIVAACTNWAAMRPDRVARRPGLRNLTLGLVVRHPGRLPAELAAELLAGAGKPGFMQALDANLSYDLRDRLPQIACPTLIVWGDGDRVISVRDAAVYAELIPDSRRIVFQDTGHMAMLERPDAFNAFLADFLNE